MVNKNIGNGIVVVGYKKYPIAWTGEIAQHIYDKNVSEDNSTAVLYVEAQQCVQKNNLTRFGKYIWSLHEKTSYTVCCLFKIENNYAIIKTAYKAKSTAEKILKGMKERNKKNSTTSKIGKVKKDSKKFKYNEADFDHLTLLDYMPKDSYEILIKEVPEKELEKMLIFFKRTMGDPTK